MIYTNETDTVNDKNKCQIHILDAIKGQDYYCINCNNIVRAKRGDKMPWHFYHVNAQQDCPFEPNMGCIQNISGSDEEDCKAKNICRRDCKLKLSTGKSQA